MPRSDDLHSLPPDLPVPIDDGACAHLPGATLPARHARGDERRARHARDAAGPHRRLRVPAHRVPDRDPPPGWDQIPGARGCTPQSCGYRDQMAAFRALGTRVFGLSTQTTAYQQEAAERLHLPFPLLSDAALELTRALRLPTFEIDGQTLLKRATLVIDAGRIVHVFYPVFPPDRDAARALDWLTAHPAAGLSPA
jgi:peroxiredoxin